MVALGAPFFYAAEANYLAVRPPLGLDPVATLLGASMVGAVIAAPIAVASGSFIDLTRPWGAAEWALLASSLLHALAYTGYVWLVGIAGPVFSSQVAYVVTVSGVLVSAVALGEDYSGWVWGALVAMIGGLALIYTVLGAAYFAGSQGVHMIVLIAMVITPQIRPTTTPTSSMPRQGWLSHWNRMISVTIMMVSR